MSQIAAIEDDIIAALKTALPGVEVDTLPGEPEAALHRARRLPAVWLIYRDGRFAPNRVLNGYVVQKVERRFLVLIVSKNLRSPEEGARGAYELLEAACETLAGLKTRGGCVELEGEDLWEARGGLFVYALRLRVTDEFRKKL